MRALSVHRKRGRWDKAVERLPRRKSHLPVRAALAKGMPGMDSARISHIELDDATILWRNADIEQERRIAIYDLVEENRFQPVRSVERGLDGPWRLRLSVAEGRLQMVIRDCNDQSAEVLLIGLAGFRRPVREYFAICDSYYQAIRKASAQEIETIDMARRAIHDRSARQLLERLEGKVETDFSTARRLFTLICVLHIKG
jgi:uncharacterized protein (UPF0262 family)